MGRGSASASASASGAGTGIGAGSGAGRAVTTPANMRAAERRIAENFIFAVQF